VPFDIGANGIVIDGETMFVTNTDRAQVVRIQIQKDGGAGAPRLLVPPSCDELSGADGLALAPDGDLIVAVNHLNKLMRVDREGHVTRLASGGPLDFPASLNRPGDPTMEKPGRRVPRPGKAPVLGDCNDCDRGSRSVDGARARLVGGRGRDDLLDGLRVWRRGSARCGWIAREPGRCGSRWIAGRRGWIDARRRRR